MHEQWFNLRMSILLVFMLKRIVTSCFDVTFAAINWNFPIIILYYADNLAIIYSAINLQLMLSSNNYIHISINCLYLLYCS